MVRRLIRLLIFAIVAVLTVVFYPQVLSPLRSDEVVPALVLVSIAVVAIRRLTSR